MGPRRSLLTGSDDPGTPGRRPALNRAKDAQTSTFILRPDRTDSKSRNDGISRGRDDDMMPAARPLPGSTPARAATEFREVAFVLLFALLAFGYLQLVRTIRMEHPGDIHPLTKAVGAGATSFNGGASHAPTPGGLPGSGTSRPD